MLLSEARGFSESYQLNSEVFLVMFPGRIIEPS
jgi:hypothetical protein